MFKSHCAVALALLLAACGAPEPRQSAPQGTSSPQSRRNAAGALYRIDPRESELRVLVYRGGAMAALGHNHVIVNRSLEGWVAFSGDAAAASFSLTIPSSGFVVDDAQPRSEEGAQFAEHVADDAKSGTLRNMLSPAVLDAANHLAITLHSVAVTQDHGALAATVVLNLAGHESHIEVPFSVDAAPGRLAAHGELVLRQTAIGLVPYSVLLGALRVEDELRLKFRFVATAQ